MGVPRSAHYRRCLQAARSEGVSDDQIAAAIAGLYEEGIPCPSITRLNRALAAQLLGTTPDLIGVLMKNEVQP